MKFVNFEVLEKIKRYFKNRNNKYVNTPLFSVDVESTLVPKNSKFCLIKKKDKQALKRYTKKGGVLVLNSGANYGYLKKVARSLGCKPLISSNNGAYITTPNSKNPIVDLKLDPKTIVKIKSKLKVREPRAIVALSGLDRKYYIDKKSKMVWLFKLQQFFRFKNKYKISTNSEKFNNKLNEVYSLQIFPLPDTPGLTKTTKPIKKIQQKEITANALNALKEILQEDEEERGKFSIGVGDMGLQICHPQANKANAIKAVTQYSNVFLPRGKDVNSSNIYAVGDGVQDIISTTVMSNPEKQFFTMDCAKPNFFEQGKRVEDAINASKMQNKIIKLSREGQVHPQRVQLKESEKFSFNKTLVDSVSKAVERIERQM